MSILLKPYVALTRSRCSLIFDHSIASSKLLPDDDYPPLTAKSSGKLKLFFSLLNVNQATLKQTKHPHPMYVHFLNIKHYTEMNFSSNLKARFVKGNVSVVKWNTNLSPNMVVVRDNNIRTRTGSCSKLIIQPFPVGICSKLTTETLEQGVKHVQSHGRLSGVFNVNFEHISHLVLVFLLLTLSW